RPAPPRTPTFWCYGTSESRTTAKKLQLLGKPENRPRQAARPGTKRRVTLLRIRTAILAVVHIENALVRHPAAHVVSIAAFAIVNIVTGGGRGMFHEPLQQRDLLVPLTHENVTELMRHGQRTQRTERVD